MFVVIRSQLSYLIRSLIISIAFLSCGNEHQQDTQYSSTQKYLLQLIASYKADYSKAASSTDKDAIRDKYLEKMRHFLVDSLGRRIDSMTVTVDSVIKKDWLVTTQFHTEDIEFKYGMQFKDSMPPFFDSLFHFMINLSPGSQVMVTFNHLGSGELNSPDDKSKKILRIHAYPEPINSK
jgi:hypothetical protein